MQGTQNSHTVGKVKVFFNFYAPHITTQNRAQKWKNICLNNELHYTIPKKINMSHPACNNTKIIQYHYVHSFYHIILTLDSFIFQAYNSWRNIFGQLNFISLTQNNTSCKDIYITQHRTETEYAGV